MTTRSRTASRYDAIRGRLSAGRGDPDRFCHLLPAPTRRISCPERPDRLPPAVGERFYTAKGDDGTTGLFYGGRVAKDDAAPEAYGAVDEAQAFIGAAR